MVSICKIPTRFAKTIQSDSRNFFKMSNDCEKAPAIVRWPTTTFRSEASRIHTAVLLNQPKKVVKYVKRGIPVDIYNNDCQPPLFCAAFLGKYKVVKALLELGANPNARCYPDGCTPVHGACYIGCTKSLKLLLHAGGDLRLTDAQRRTPLDWSILQLDEIKRRNIRDVLDGARVCAFKSSSNGKEMLTEMEARIGIGKSKSIGTTASSSSPHGSSLPMRLLRATICCPPLQLPPSDNLITSEVRLNNCILPIGYGKVFFGIDQTHSKRCGGLIGLPFLNEISDLKLEEDTASASWICGKFTTFVPMIWVSRKMSVNVRELRKSTVDDAIPDILISELGSLAKLHHPNLLMCLAVCHVDNYDSISLVFEKVSMGTLYFVLYNQLKRLSSRLVTEIIVQICEALDYIHCSGYLHNFVNSHSIFLLDGGRAKLGCLEYVTRLGASTESIQVSSHPHIRSDHHLSIYRHWAAPELLTGKRAVSVASDVYSICCVMWELIYGDVPWKDYDLDTLRSLMTENPYARLQLDKGVVPHLWYGILNVGLEPEAPLRDIDLSEIRDMMKISQSKIDLGAGGEPDLKKSSSRASLKSVHDDPYVPSLDDVDNLSKSTKEMEKCVSCSSLFKRAMQGPHTAV